MDMEDSPTYGKSVFAEFLELRDKYLWDGTLKGFRNLKRGTLVIVGEAEDGTPKYLVR